MNTGRVVIIMGRDSFVTFEIIVSSKYRKLLEEFKSKCSDEFRITNEPNIFNGKFLFITSKRPEEIRAIISIRSEFLDKFEKFANNFWDENRFHWHYHIYHLG